MSSRIANTSTPITAERHLPTFPRPAIAVALYGSEEEVLISLGQFKSITVESSYPTSGLDRAVACLSPERWLSSFDRAQLSAPPHHFLSNIQFTGLQSLGCVDETLEKY